MSSAARFEALFQRRVGTIRPGLERVAAAYAVLGYPSRTTPTILVGGTNGKGSTAGFLWQLLAANGLQVGLFSSPHLRFYSERMQCSATEIDDADVESAFQELEKCLPPELYDELSFFEITTLLGLRIFAAANTDINIIEVGMGGRWDATNITDPIASVIVSVSFDHQQYLGNTLALIAQEKLGIIRRGRPLFTGNMATLKSEPGAFAEFVATALAAGVPRYSLGEDFAATNLPPTLAELAPFLADNFALARAVYQWLEAGSLLPSLLPVDAALAAIRQRHVPCPPTLLGRCLRLECVGPESVQRLLVDVSHNVDGVAALRQALGFGNGLVRQKLPALVSILSDKDLGAILDILAEFLQPILLFKIDNVRSLTRESLPARHSQLPLYETWEEAYAALAQAVPPAADWTEPWVVCGSVAAVGKVLDYFGVTADYNCAGSGVLGGHSVLRVQSAPLRAEFDA